MKYCPHCNDRRFSDHVVVCPVCHTKLLDAAVKSGSNPVDGAGEDVPFLRRRFGTRICHGRVAEVKPQGLSDLELSKLWDAFGLGKPLQPSRQPLKTTIRVQNITSMTPTEEIDFCVKGDYSRHISVGDEVIIRAKERRGMRVVQRIENVTTHSRLRPGVQGPDDRANGRMKVWICLALLLLIVPVNTAFFFPPTRNVGLLLLGACVNLLMLGVCIWMIIRTPRSKR